MALIHSLVRGIRTASALALAGLLVACAHPISVIPESTPPRDEASLIQKKVAYAISDADRAKEVITPGGGGDRVSYYPYRDLEKGIREALRSVYQDVVAVPTPDAKALAGTGATLLFVPEIKTTSSSPSPFTWPPTQFTTEITCSVMDSSGQKITQVVASGSGTAEFSEFKSNFSLSANRAGTAVAARLSEEIRKNEKLR